MNILEALKQGRSQGRAIRRDSWPPTRQVWCKAGDVLMLMFNTTDEPWVYLAGWLDIQAEDWNLSTTLTWRGVNIYHPKPLNCKGKILMEIYFEDEADLKRKKAAAQALVDEINLPINKTDSPMPPLGLDKDCETCLHKAVLATELPCLDCVNGQGQHDHYTT